MLSFSPDGRTFSVKIPLYPGTTGNQLYGAANPGARAGNSTQSIRDKNGSSQFTTADCRQPKPATFHLIAFARSNGLVLTYSLTPVTTPAPTVRPPSRIAKRSPSSMAMGVISAISTLMLSPGITISTPSGKVTTPVTSVVRK